MKTTCFLSLLLAAALISCDENSYDRHSQTDDLITNDTLSGFQTGPEYESVADPNAANTKKTAVPLEPVVVDTTETNGQ